MACKASDMHFINDSLGERPSQQGVSFPVVCGEVGDHALQRGRRVVARLASVAAAADLRRGDAPAVRIEQQLLRIEPEASCRIEGPCDPVAIDLAGNDVGNKYVPIVVGPVLTRVELNDAEWFLRFDMIKKHELNRRGVFGVDAEIGALGRKRCPERKTSPLHRYASCRCLASRWSAAAFLHKLCSGPEMLALSCGSADPSH